MEDENFMVLELKKELELRNKFPLIAKIQAIKNTNGTGVFGDLLAATNFVALAKNPLAMFAGDLKSGILLIDTPRYNGVEPTSLKEIQFSVQERPSGNDNSILSCVAQGQRKADDSSIHIVIDDLPMGTAY